MIRGLGWGCLIWLTTAQLAGAIEPWADERLAVRDGIAVWLDGAAQRAARAALGEPPLTDEAAVDAWHDASGERRDAKQADEALRPVWRVADASTTVRLSGRGPFLTIDDLGLALQDATVFVVAAPFHNEGDFRGFLSLHGKGKADFLSGMNIDQGYASTPDFSAINVEGAGAGGQQNLRTAQGEFRAWQRICVESRVGAQGIRLFVDGRPEGTRKRDDSVIEADRLIVGGRFTGGIEAVHFLLAGEIAEVIIYDRALRDDERAEVDAYLAAKYSSLPPVPPPQDDPSIRQVKLVDSPPPVQMFVPGFEVRELPVKLTNVNNVLYREDGALVALAYDGNIYLLRDTDGDGVEDDSQVFWKNEGGIQAPIGLALTPPGYERGHGVFVACRGKIVLLLDKDGDDVAEEEVVVADGWPQLFHQVDALGVAVDPKDQSVYFGIGTENFTNGHLVDKNGVAKYRLDNEHGTILRVAPDFKSREIVATGIRFPVAMRFNKDDELFCTDQEGATWLANGNPFDELLHIERGRHYGFPPRHPRHLPNVIDEPSVFDYRPQHQCATGLNFNEPASDGAIFGPDWWQSDAFVTGFSRGKLYRTKMARTEHGYVGQNQIIGATNMMPADACVGPGRTLAVAMHSGGPDWGNGPSGEGKLYKVKYVPRDDAPIPSLVWAESPREVRIAFDRPVDPALLKDLAKRISIDGGEFVAAGDRFESFRPGYAVVERQMNSPRFGVEVQGVQLTADRRTLIVTTAPQTLSVNYGVSLPGIVKPTESPGSASTALPQYPDVELQYDLCGVEATWEPENGEPQRVWLPHVDLLASKELTVGSAEHEAFWKSLEGAGTLRLRTTVDLRQMLRPAVQPGAKLDHEWPEEEVTLGFSGAGGPMKVTMDGRLSDELMSDGGNGGRLVVAKGAGALHPLEIEIQKSTSSPQLHVFFTTSEDKRPRALALRRFLLPWAEESTQPTELVNNRDLPELKGGNWLRGQREFFGTTANCSKCHTMRGAGGKIGPDLSNLPQRDYASVLRDVTQPSFAINPDFTSQVVLLADGRTLAGTTRVDGDNLIVADQEGKETSVPRAEVEELAHSPQSIMPEGLPKALGEERLRDLMTFLLVEPPHMPVYGELPPPPPRRMADVEAVLAGAEKIDSPRPLRVLLVSGPKDHGAGEHDYPAWLVMWRQLLEMAEGVTVDTAETWPTAEQFSAADAVVFFQKGDWTPERARDLDAFLARGGGASYIHYAVDGGNDGLGFAERIGLAWIGGRSKFRHGPLDVSFAAGKNHPGGRNFDQVDFYDESYWQLHGDPGQVNLLATCIEEGAEQPLFWTREQNGGRVFVSIPGHYSWTFDDPLFRILLLRGMAWTAQEPADRFNELALPGARVRAAAE